MNCIYNTSVMIAQVLNPRKPALNIINAGNYFNTASKLDALANSWFWVFELQ